MTLVWLGIALWCTVVISFLMCRLVDWLYRPLRDIEYLEAVARLDEMIAREAVRPHGNVEVLYIPEWVTKQAS